MTLEVPIPKHFGPSQAGPWFQSWHRVAKEPHVSLRLPAGAFLRPTGIVLLAAGIAERQALGLKTSLAAEPAEDAYRYLQQIDFFATLGVNTTERFTPREAAGRFVPLRQITDERTAQELAQESAECLRSQVPDLSSSPLRMARFVFEELGVNIVQHSGAATTGFGVMQSFPKGIELAFADRGIGFLASLQKNPEFAGRIGDEAEALQLSLGKGATGTSEPRRNMGMGLALLQDFSDRLGGELWIASGASTLRRRSVAGVRTTTVHSNEAWRGSWICLDALLGGV